MDLRRRPRFALPMILLAAVTACTGGAAQAPEDQLVSALRAAGDGPGITLTVSLNADEASLAALQAQAPDTLPTEAVALIAKAAVYISVPFAPEARAAELALVSAGQDLFTLRVVDDALYVRAQAGKLVEALGQDPALVETYRAMLTGSGVLPPEALEGRWISVADFTGLAGRLGGDAGAGHTEAPHPLDRLRGDEALRRFAEALGAAPIRRAGTGADGDHLVATMSLRDLRRALTVDKTAGSGAVTDAPPAEDTPDTPVDVDLWVKDGRLSVVEFDLRQAPGAGPLPTPLPEGVGRVALRVELTPFDGVVEAPADAIPFQPEALMGLLMGGMTGAFGDSMAGVMPQHFGGMPPGHAPGMAPETMVPPEMMAPPPAPQG